MPYVTVSEQAQAKIRMQRLSKGYSQVQLAERATVSLNTLRKVETERHPRVQETTILRVCSTLGLAAADILQDVGALGVFEKGRMQLSNSRIQVFIAAPVSSAGDRFPEHRISMLPVVAAVRTAVAGGEVFCALEERESTERSEDEALALAGNLARLERSNRLLAFQFAPVASSVFVEIGIALALRIPTMVLVRDRADLPWMLKGHSNGNPPYRVTRFRSIEEILQILRQERAWLRGDEP